jgi:hypothetical protein
LVGEEVVVLVVVELGVVVLEVVLAGAVVFVPLPEVVPDEVPLVVVEEGVVELVVVGLAAGAGVAVAVELVVVGVSPPACLGARMKNQTTAKMAPRITRIAKITRKIARGLFSIQSFPNLKLSELGSTAPEGSTIK